MKVALIWAMAQNRIIGRDGDLPWHLPRDLAHFKRTTHGHTVIMGRKTWDSLPKALPGRRNMVITRQSDYQVEGAEVFSSLDAALEAASDQERVFVLGGAEIYALAIPRAEELYITFVHADVEGDTEFPPLDITEWIVESHEQFPADEDNELACAIAKMTRKPAKRSKPKPAAPAADG